MNATVTVHFKGSDKDNLVVPNVGSIDPSERGGFVCLWTDYGNQSAGGKVLISASEILYLEAQEQKTPEDLMREAIGETP